MELDDRPTVGVVLLNWNGGEFTIPCIESLLKSTYRKYKIFVIDNGSTDDSPQRIKEFPAVYVEELKKNVGFTGGNNLGIQRALSAGVNYIWILNNDTIVDPACMEELVTQMEKDSSIAIGTNKIFYYDPNDVIWFAGGEHNLLTGKTVHFGMDKKDSRKFSMAREVGFATGCSMFIRSEILVCYGGFDDRLFIYSEDLDLSLRIREHGFKIFYFPDAILFHRVSASVVKNTKGNSRGSKMTPFKHYLSTRNQILVTKKHTSFLSFCVFIINFVTCRLVFLSGALVFLRRWDKLISVWKGVLDGMKTPKTGGTCTRF